MTDTATPDQDAMKDDNGWEWAIVEIFGHRRHAGRTREEERFGAKMLRIDVPIVIWRDVAEGGRAAEISGWSTLYYGGASIFSFALSDEKTIIRANQPYEPASRLTYQPRDDEPMMMSRIETRRGMGEFPSRHPDFLQQALDAEAELWARETDVAGWIARIAEGEENREGLLRLAKLCFVEGAYRGALNVIDKKSLEESIAEAAYGRG